MIAIFIILLASVVTIFVCMLLEEETFKRGFCIGATFAVLLAFLLGIGILLHENYLHKDYCYTVEEVSEIAIDTTYIVNETSTDTIFTLHYNKTNK